MGSRRRAARYLLFALAGAAIGLAVAGSRLGNPVPPSTHADATPGTNVVPPAGVAAWSGVTWQILGVERTPADLGVGRHVADAISWHGGIIATTVEIDHERKHARIWRSTDDKDWREASDGSPLDQIGQPSLFVIGDRLLLLGQHEPVDTLASHDPSEWYGVAFELADGDHWTQITDANSPYILHNSYPTAGHGLILVLEGADLLWRSADDGATWKRTAVKDLVGDGYIANIVWFRNRWVASGYAGRGSATTPGEPEGSGTIWTSPDAATWTRQAVDVPGMNLSGLAVGANGIVAQGYGTGSQVEYSKVMWTSSDGSSWITLPFDAYNVQVIGDGTRLVMRDQAPGEPPRLRESFDGFNWHDVPLTWADAPAADDPWRLGSLHHFPGQMAPVVLQPTGLWSIFDDQLQGDDPDRWNAIVRAIGAQPAPPGG